MTRTHSAIYYDELNHFYNATIFISSVTLTMRFRNENGQDIDRNWLGENILSLEETELQSTLIYKNESGNPERLVIRDPALLAEIKYQFRHLRFTGSHWRHRSGGLRSKFLTVIVIILALLALVYFLFVPWLGERVAMKFSKDREIALGEQMYKTTMVGTETDTRKTALLNEFYKELHYDIDYPIEITVVKSPDVNAFAVPGGHIVVFDRILENMKTPEELAALLGHEASHVELRHSLKNISRSVARKMFLMVILGGDAGVAGYLADRADDLKGLQYSRELETEADDNGLALMERSGIDTKGMLDLMFLLQRESEGHETSALLSTHPVFNSRIKNIKKQMKTTDVKRDDKLAEIFHELFEN
ncbi:MAG: M48 family metallopeptidase [Flavitalea sp.]